MLIFIEIILVLYTFTKSILAGIMIATYILIMKKQIEDLKRMARINNVIGDDLEKDFTEPKKMLKDFIVYKGCTIENYGSYYLMREPSGERLRKHFESIGEAKQWIDENCDDTPIPHSKRRVHNIRFVR